MQVNFKANYICEVPLKYVKRKGCFVELNPRDINDLLSLRKVSEGWDTNLTNGIFDDALENHAAYDSKTKFFAVTRQRNNLEFLNPDLILGLAETINMSKEKIKLHILQVNPLNKREGIGSSIIKHLQNIFPIILMKCQYQAMVPCFLR